MYTAKLTSECSVCHNRHIHSSHKNYLLHFACLPFKCEHGNKISNLHVEDAEERTLPFVNLPSQIQKVAPECLSLSSGGLTTTDKLDRDKKRLEQTFEAADKAFTTLATNVGNSNVDLDAFPQYGTDHINCLLAALEEQVEDCCTYLDDHRNNLIRLSEVSEADNIHISPDGLTIVTGSNIPSVSQPEATIGASQHRPETPLLDRPNPETQLGSTNSSGDTLIPSMSPSTTTSSVSAAASLTTTPQLTATTSSARMSSRPQSLATSVSGLQGTSPSIEIPSAIISRRSSSIAAVFNHSSDSHTRTTRGLDIGIASGVTQGLGLLQHSEQLQAEAVRRCQLEMFASQSELLTNETSSLQQSVTDNKTRMTSIAVKALHNELSVLDRKLSDLSSLRQCYITNQVTREDMESELVRTEAILKAHSLKQSLIRRDIINAEIGIETPNNAAIASRHQPPVTNFLQKLSLPCFNGKVAEYPSFRQRFKDLTETGGYPLSVILEHLKLALPRDHQHLVEASRTLEEVWARLDEEFGNKTMTILTVQRSLVNLDLAKYKEYEKVARLHNEISRGLRLLAPLNAEDAIVKDLQLVSRLVEKLPEPLQVEWSCQATKAGRTVEPGNTEWPKFISWLDEERRAAVLRRDYQLTRGGSDTRLGPGPVTSSQKPHCYRCKVPGHRTNECPNSARTTLADINNVEEGDSDDENIVTCNFASTEDCVRRYKETEKRMGKCPHCKALHTYRLADGTGHLDWPSARLNTCKQFMKLPPVERGEKARGVQSLSQMYRLEA